MDTAPDRPPPGTRGRDFGAHAAARQRRPARSVIIAVGICLLSLAVGQGVRSAAMNEPHGVGFRLVLTRGWSSRAVRASDPAGTTLVVMSPPPTDATSSQVAFTIDVAVAPPAAQPEGSPLTMAVPSFDGSPVTPVVNTACYHCGIVAVTRFSDNGERYQVATRGSCWASSRACVSAAATALTSFSDGWTWSSPALVGIESGVGVLVLLLLIWVWISSRMTARRRRRERALRRATVDREARAAQSTE